VAEIKMVQPNPQPLETLKDRFYDAIKRSFSVQKVIDKVEERPGSLPEHVFDFEEGIRIIISRDRYKEKEVIHFSASLLGNYITDTRIPPRLQIAKFLGEATVLFAKLSGCKTSDVILIGFSDEKQIPHWVVELSIILN
jgi:hypothetical protein